LWYRSPTVKRHAASALVTLAVAVGLLDPYACVQYSAGSSLKRPISPISKTEQTRLRDVARRGLGLIPAPRGYALDPTSVTAEADDSAPWDEARGSWAAPATARAERVFEAARGSDDNAPPAMEQRVFVNSAVEAPSGLASEGGTPRAFPVPGASAIEVTMIGAEDATPAPAEEGRIAMPVTPVKAASAVTIIRILLADPETERAFRATAGGSTPLPARSPPARPGAIRTLVVELYGGKRDVESLASYLPTTSLRRLLDRR